MTAAGRTQAQGAAGRRRRRHHPAARAVRDASRPAPGDLTLLYRASDQRDVVFRSELEHLAERREAPGCSSSAGRRADLGYDPLSAPALTRLTSRTSPHHDVYLCGPPGMTTAAIAALREAGVPRRQIHHESFEF